MPTKSVSGACAIEGTVGVNNFKAFPVSAFGECEMVLLKGRPVERPAQTRSLESFQLEAPFVWIAQRRDEIDLADYEEKVRSLSRFRPTIPWNVYKLKRHGKELVGRKLASKRPWPSLRLSDRPARQRPLEDLLVRLTTVLMVWLCSEASYDRFRYWRVATTIANPAVTESQLDNADAWLDDYVNSAGYRHILSRLFLRKTDAAKRLTEMRQKREDELWAPVKAWLLLSAGPEDPKPILRNTQMAVMPRQRGNGLQNITIT